MEFCFAFSVGTLNISMTKLELLRNELSISWILLMCQHIDKSLKKKIHSYIKTHTLDFYSCLMICCVLNVLFIFYLCLENDDIMS